MTAGAESTPAPVSAAERAVAAALETAAGVAAEAPKPERPPFREVWWRYLVGLIAMAFALFPVVYVVSAAFNPVPSLSTASVIPEGVTLDNFRAILSDPQEPYPNWYLNTMIIATATAVVTVLLGALAAYAFSRFRFKGRRFGMLSLLLIQMFPQFLAVVAIYLIMLDISDVFPGIGLNTRTGLMLVYLGGALGVNAWLLVGLLQLDTRRARRVGQGRRRDPGADLLGRHPPARRARARRDRAALVRLDAERVHHRVPAPAGTREVHALRRAVRLHLRSVRPGMGAVLRRRRARRRCPWC